jgi:hypothetical protein
MVDVKGVALHERRLGDQTMRVVVKQPLCGISVFAVIED